jgi:hypothetical protein
MTAERSLTRQVIAHLKRLRVSGEPIWWLKIHGHPMQQAGPPDLLIYYRGQSLLVELKAPGESLTRLQEHTIAQIRHAGGRVLVAEAAEEVVSFLEDVRCNFH